MRFRFSILTMLISVTVIALALGLGLGAYRYLFPPPGYSLTAVLYSVTDRYHFYALGESYELTVARDLVTQTPAWDRRQVNPPIAAGEALALGEQLRLRWIKEKKLRADPDIGDWYFRSLSLSATDETHWYWLLQFHFMTEGSGPPHEFYVAVLMDGTVVEPTWHPKPAEWHPKPAEH